MRLTLKFEIKEDAIAPLPLPLNDVPIQLLTYLHNTKLTNISVL